MGTATDIQKTTFTSISFLTEYRKEIKESFWQRYKNKDIRATSWRGTTISFFLNISIIRNEIRIIDNANIRK